MRYWLGFLSVLVVGCVETVPSAESFLDQQDIVADSAVPADGGPDVAPLDTDIGSDVAADGVDADTGSDVAADGVDTDTGSDVVADSVDSDTGSDVVADTADADAGQPDAAPDAVDADADGDTTGDTGPSCTAAQCDDQNPCTDDSCGDAGACVHLANAATCSDGNACTLGDSCAASVCMPGAVTGCDDGNSCSADSCDTASGCLHTAASGTCTLADKCVSAASCQEGGCVALGTVSCDDGNPCTTDGCTPQSGCSHVAQTDGTACSAKSCGAGGWQDASTCLAGSCSATPTVQDCDDQNACTTDSCNALQGCLHSVNTASCDDGDACTSADVCASGTCKGVSVTCDDGQLCTTDSCDANSGCSHTANTLACDDGNPCTVGDQCAGGTCMPGAAPLDCDDKNPCTTDGCAAGGCTHTNNVNSCSDGNACTQSDTCQNGACVGANPVVCTASDQCHAVGSCDTTSGTCSNPGKTNGATCSDGNACTVADTCQSGACVAGTAKTCTASDTCHAAGTCDTTSGSCSNPTKSDGSACSDGTVCTVNDACSAGVCTGSATLWSKTYGATVEHLVSAVVGLDDGGVIMAVQSMNGGSAGIDTTVSRLDTLGNTLWSQTFATPGDDILNAGVRDVGTVAFIGHQASKSGASWFLALAVADGGLVQSTNVASGENAIIVDGEGYATVGGNTLTRLHSDGTLKNTYTYNSPANLEITSLAPITSGGWILGGNVPTGCCGTAGYAIGVDSYGNKLWGQLFDDGKSASSTLMGVAALPDGSFNVVVNAFSNTDIAFALFMHRLGVDGAPLWMREVGGLNNAKKGIGALTLSDGMLVSGYNQIAPSGLFAVRLDTAGNTLWEKDPKAGDLFALGQSVASTPQGVWIGGAQDGSDGRQGYLVRLDSFGNSTCAASGDCAGKSPSDCGDGNLCTNDACSAGVCSHVNFASGAYCDDVNLCTLDVCDANGGCKSTAVSDGLRCEDGSPCTLQDSCKAGACAAGHKSTFSHALGFDYYAGLSGIAVSATGYAFAGRAHGTDNLWMVVTDLGGTILNSDANGDAGNVVDLGGFDELHDVVAAGSGWTFAGNTGVDQTHDDGVLYAVAADGLTMLWKKTYGGTGQDELHAIATRPGGYVACGGTSSSLLGGDENFWLLTTDTSGNNAKSHNFYDPASYYQSCAGVIVAANGDIVMAGRADNGGWVVRTDASGAKLWDKRIAGDLNSTTSLGTSFGKIVEVAGTLYVVGSYVASPTATSKVWLVALDANGNVLWQKTYGSTADDFGSGITATGDGLILAGATDGFGAPAREGYVVRTDLNGNLLWQKAIPRPADTTNATGTCSLAAVATATDGFVLAGIDDQKGWGDGWIVKLDTWGNVTCADSGSCGGQTEALCDDANPCTADVCLATNAGLCSHTALPDGVACGAAKTCSAGVCQ